MSISFTALFMFMLSIDAPKRPKMTLPSSFLWFLLLYLVNLHFNTQTRCFTHILCRLTHFDGIFSNVTQQVIYVKTSFGSLDIRNEYSPTQLIVIEKQFGNTSPQNLSQSPFHYQYSALIKCRMKELIMNFMKKFDLI